MDKETIIRRYYHISDYLEQQLREINQKVEHIIFRLRYEDPRIWKPASKNGNLEDQEELDYPK